MLPLSPLCTLNGNNNAQLSGTIAEAEVLLVVVKDRTRKQARQRINGMHVKERKFAIGKKGVQSKGVKFRFTNHLYKKGIISNADSDADQEAEHQA